jgi:hypothetical protein
VESKRGKYGSAGTSAIIMDCCARIASELRATGVPLAAFVEANNSTSYSVAHRTLQERVAAGDAGEAPLPTMKCRGRRGKLTVAQRVAVARAILLADVSTDLQRMATWRRDNFDISVDHSSCLVTWPVCSC